MKNGQKTINGVDMTLFDSVVIMYLTQTNCIKGDIPEITKFFYPMPVPIVLAVKYNNGIPRYSLYQMEADTFNHLGDGDKISTKDDGTIYLLETVTNENNVQETKVYMLELDHEAYYVKYELIFL